MKLKFNSSGTIDTLEHFKKLETKKSRHFTPVSLKFHNSPNLPYYTHLTIHRFLFTDNNY